MMKRTKKLTALLLAGVLAVGVAAPVTKAQAADIQPLPFPTYVNGSQVTINNSLLYGGHTYVQLRELASVTNMDVDFVAMDHSTTAGPGGGLPNGISINQPTFVYVKNDVQDWTGDELNMVDKAVNIHTLFLKYLDREGKLDYRFDGNGNLIVPDGDGGEKVIPVHVFNSYGNYYVSVDEFRDKIQPYLVDMCMQ